jgi:hypothetical protein
MLKRKLKYQRIILQINLRLLWKELYKIWKLNRKIFLILKHNNNKIIKEQNQIALITNNKINKNSIYMIEFIKRLKIK